MDVVVAVRDKFGQLWDLGDFVELYIWDLCKLVDCAFVLG